MTLDMLYMTPYTFDAAAECARDEWRQCDVVLILHCFLH